MRPTLAVASQFGTLPSNYKMTPYCHACFQPKLPHFVFSHLRGVQHTFGFRLSATRTSPRNSGPCALSISVRYTVSPSSLTSVVYLKDYQLKGRVNSRKRLGNQATFDPSSPAPIKMHYKVLENFPYF